MSAIVVRPLSEADLPAADRINRVAFGTFFGLDDPTTFRGDGDVVPGRFRANPDGAFAAEIDGRLVACGFVMNWGSVGILGPLTVDVDYWSRGVARATMPAMVDYMDRAGFTVQGLLTHPQSPKHVRLYESFGFRMDRITGVMDKTIDPASTPAGGALLYSTLSAAEKAAAIDACRQVADSVHPGFDLGREIRSIDAEGFGDTVLVEGDRGIEAFACCHQGAGSEAGSAHALVKVAVVRGGPAAAANFGQLTAACEDFAAARGVRRIVAGTNTGRREAYAALQHAGYRTWMNAIVMLRTPGTGYNRPDVYVIDDWR